MFLNRFDVGSIKVIILSERKQQFLVLNCFDTIHSRRQNSVKHKVGI